MYQLLRKTHLFTALTLFLFILFYAVSGYVIQFPNSTRWSLAIGPRTTQTLPFDRSAINGPINTPEFAAYVKQTCGLHGKFAQLQFNEKAGTCSYVFVGAKGSDNAKLLKDATQITITTTNAGFYAMLNRMHHLNGYDGEGIYKIWAVMFDLVCLAMILFAFSGIYLWYKLTKRRLFGWVVLASSIGYTTATVIYCAWAK